jgi:hypothetical protein
MKNPKGALPNRVFRLNTTALAMVKLIEAAQKTWRRLDEHNQLPKVVLGATFSNGLEVETANHQPKAAA